jgi:hypothetical protein
MIHKQSDWTSRTDVKWNIEPGTELGMVSSLEWEAKYNQLRELSRKIAGP